ncbi:MAG: hypothetical protein M3Y53_12460 [Thermoproteota archaeon]|nr:hypothetical protein [Thermoproteota archaeon]
MGATKYISILALVNRKYLNLCILSELTDDWKRNKFDHYGAIVIGMTPISLSGSMLSVMLNSNHIQSKS